jgi:serine/threonine protein kinase
MSIEQVRCYMRALFGALAHIHERNVRTRVAPLAHAWPRGDCPFSLAVQVIHADLKPGNFLYDYERDPLTLARRAAREGKTERRAPDPAAAPSGGTRASPPPSLFCLVDFGLSQTVNARAAHGRPCSPSHTHACVCVQEATRTEIRKRKAVELAPIDHGPEAARRRVQEVAKLSVAVRRQCTERLNLPPFSDGRHGTRGYRAPEVMWHCAPLTTGNVRCRSFARAPS